MKTKRKTALKKKIFEKGRWITTTKPAPVKKYKALFKDKGIMYYIPRKK